MKKIISLILSAGILASLSACGSDGGYLGEDYVGGNGGEYYCRIMETENGFYNNSVGYMSLSYYDKKTGKAIYLCNKPECRHDGNLFCTATKDSLAIDGTYLYGDYVYFNAIDYSKAEEGTLYYKLYKTAVDATELSEVGTYQQVKTGVGFAIDFDGKGRELIIHRDWAIIPFDDTELPTLVEDASPNVMLMNVRTGECKRLPTADYDLTKTQYGQGDFFASGDWFYYAVEPQHYKNTKYLYRYNLVTGESEKIDIPKHFDDFCVYDGNIRYTTNNTASEGPCKLFKYNIESKETVTLCDNLTVGGVEPLKVDLLCDGEYIVIRNEMDYIEYFGSKGKNDYVIFDMDGKKLTEFSITSDLVSDDVYETKLHGGKLYICSDYTVTLENGDLSSFSQPEEAICCLVEDIVSGNIKWEKPYDFYSLHAEFIEEVLSDMEEYEEEMEENE